MKLSEAVSSRVARLELDEKFERRLIRSLLEALHHLIPVLFKNVGTAAARFVAEASVRFWSNDHAASTSVSAPEVYAPEERFVLLRGKSTRKLDAQLFEELCSVNVWEPFKATAHDRPHHPQRLYSGMTALGVDRLRSLRHLCRR